MKHLKQQIVNQILFFVQDLHEPGTFLHTVITGPPGTGKTCLTHIMSKIYRSLGFLSNDKIVIADRANLIGMYLGHTAVQTKKVMDSAKGGIVLIDEAYSLGSEEGRDSFAKECIDTINQYLSEHCDDLICIIAGYKNEIEKCFFKQNSGLDRRFPWRFNIEKYNGKELTEIMYRQLKSWSIVADRKFVEKKLEENLSCFKGNGGDTQNLLDKCKISHARRVFVELAKKEENNKDSDKEKQEETKEEKKTKKVTIKIKKTRSNTKNKKNYKKGNRKRKRSDKDDISETSDKSVKELNFEVNKEINKEDFEKGFENFLKVKKESKGDGISKQVRDSLYT